MGRRADPGDLIRQEGPALFSFLAPAGFLSPERTENGLAYHRPGLHIEIRYSDGVEPEMVTTIVVTTSTGEQTTGTSQRSYVASRCGPLQDVPGTVSNPKVAIKRIRQHAEALRKVLPRLTDGDAEHLVRRCQGRLIPEPPGR